MLRVLESQLDPLSCQRLFLVRQTLNYHEIFRKSQAQTQLTALLHALGSSGSSNPIKAIRYVAMQDFTPNSQALGKGAPFTGSAIYLNPTAAWHEGAWPLWTHIVRYIDGCMGCCGGQILGGVELMGEPTYAGEVKVEGEKMERWEKEKWEGYLVYVGWESVVSGSFDCAYSLLLCYATRIRWWLRRAMVSEQFGEVS